MDEGMSGRSGSLAPKALFYVQHLLGIGHIARASRIASAMKDDGFDVTVITGGLPVPGFPADGISVIALPPVVASNAGFSGLADSEGQPANETFLSCRRDRLLEIFHRLKPDMVIIEAFPFGRRQMRFELIPLIEAIESSPAAPEAHHICARYRSTADETGSERGNGSPDQGSFRLCSGAWR